MCVVRVLVWGGNRLGVRHVMRMLSSVFLCFMLAFGVCPNTRGGGVTTQVLLAQEKVVVDKCTLLASFLLLDLWFVWR